jgi:hypothetical protein
MKLHAPTVDLRRHHERHIQHIDTYGKNGNYPRAVEPPSSLLGTERDKERPESLV